MVLKSGSLNLLEPSEPAQASNWIVLPFNYTVYVLPLSSLLHDLVLTFIFFYLPYLFLLNILSLLHVFYPSLYLCGKSRDAVTQRADVTVQKPHRRSDTTAKYRHMGATNISQKGGGGAQPQICLCSLVSVI